MKHWDQTEDLLEALRSDEYLLEALGAGVGRQCWVRHLILFFVERVQKLRHVFVDMSPERVSSLI